MFARSIGAAAVGFAVLATIGTAGTAVVAPAAAARTPRSVAQAAYNRMSPRERIGQLFIIGIPAQGPSSADLDQLSADRAGNVYLSGRTTAGRFAVKHVTATLRNATTYASVGPYLGTDQEGGEVQVLQGPGFDRMPTGLAQGRLTLTQLSADARLWGRQLRYAGLNLDLAPVSDTVPKDVGTSNQPIGQYYREFGYSVLRVRRHVTAFVQGMRGARVATTVKHFPGLGRATGNTDSSQNVTDPTGPNDPYLSPYLKGIEAGTDFVMVSSATYPKIDKHHLACFSSIVMHDLLRGKLGFRGIVVSDSFGAAAVSYLPAAERALRYFGRGGTMLLDSAVAQLHPMATAVLTRTRHDAGFAAMIKSDVLQVLTAKARAGLIG